MQINVLGPLEVVVAGVPVGIAGARLRRVVVRLAVDAGRAVSSAALVDAVWLGQPPADAANALQSLISRLRKVLGDPAAIAQGHGGYRLAVDPKSVDVNTFAALAGKGRTQLATGDLVTAAELLTSALDLWRGEPLADAEGAEYAQPLGTRLAEEAQQARGDRFDAYLELGRAAEVLAELEESAAADLLRERSTGQLMRALAAMGRSAEALARYERLRAYLADELGVDPSPALAEAHLALLRGEGQPVASRVSRAPHRTNIGPSLTSFIGREIELARVTDLLEQGRLATIVGPGGAGKTRLAAEIGRRRLARHPDGVWMVELAQVSEEANIIATLLGVLGRRETNVLDRRVEWGNREPFEVLTDALESADCMLVMDNCEHLIASVAQLTSRILQRCDSVKILATSREPLGIGGESLALIPPLELPPIGATAAKALQYPAVQLLAERAWAVNADFIVDERTVAPSVEIVRRLDGLPLAIELATALLRVLPIEELAARLSDRFRLLTGGNRTALPRHRTLRAVVDWSWDLLSDTERLLAERLAVFPAGATAESAAAVCADDRIPAPDIPGLLLALADKSLVQVVDTRPVRYRMLETIREYGTDRLTERGTAQQARAAHAWYFAGLAARSDPILRTAGQLQALKVFKAERDNILAALSFLGDSGEQDAALDLGFALYWFWTLTGAHAESLNWLHFLLRVTEGSSRPDRVYAVASMEMENLMNGPRPESASFEVIRQQVGAVFEQLAGAEPGLAVLGLIRPMLALFSGDTVRGRAEMEPFLKSEDPWLRGAIQIIRAGHAENEGDVQQMREAATAALAEFEAIGDRWGLFSSLTVRGMVRTLDGDLADAICDYERSLAYSSQLGAGEDDVLSHLRLADLKLRVGDLTGARMHAESARVSTLGVRQGVGVEGLADCALASIALEQGEITQARGLISRVRTLVDDGQDDALFGHMAALVLSVSAGIEMADGRLDAAKIDLDRAYPQAADTRDMPVVAVVGSAVAAYAQAVGRPREAAEILGAAAQVRGSDDLTNIQISRIIDQLRTDLGEAFEDAYATGRGLNRSAAVDRLNPVLLAAVDRPAPTIAAAVG